jgi:hypothetical protein
MERMSFLQEDKMARFTLLSVVLIACLAATSAAAKEGCGAGFHFNDKKGICVPNKQGGAAVTTGGAAVTGGAVVTTPGVAVGVGVSTAPGAVVGKACPVGYHLGPNGHCRPN